MSNEIIPGIDPSVNAWLHAELEKDGPWKLKSTTKEKVNCLLGFKMSGKGKQSINLRGYLCDSDPDEVWTRSMNEKVIPFVSKNFQKESWNG